MTTPTTDMTNNWETMRKAVKEARDSSVAEMQLYVQVNNYQEAWKKQVTTATWNEVFTMMQKMEAGSFFGTTSPPVGPTKL